jgi:hypothetical protein
MAALVPELAQKMGLPLEGAPSVPAPPEAELAEDALVAQILAAAADLTPDALDRARSADKPTRTR